MFSDAPGYASPAQIFPDSFLSLAEDGLSFLQNHVWSEVHSENDFAASVAVAKAILHGAEQKPDIMIRYSDTSEVRSFSHLWIKESDEAQAEKFPTDIECANLEHFSVRSFVEHFNDLDCVPLRPLLRLFFCL